VPVVQVAILAQIAIRRIVLWKATVMETGHVLLLICALVIPVGRVTAIAQLLLVMQ